MSAVDWEIFLDLDEDGQAKFLLHIAEKALSFIVSDMEIYRIILHYLKLARSIVDGDYGKINQLMVFLEDENMKNDFSSFWEILKESEKDSAALDIISYACGFICRCAAKKAGIRTLPDPVIESVPDIYEYYRDRAKLLEI